jgi:hypothetical protein
MRECAVANPRAYFRQIAGKYKRLLPPTLNHNLACPPKGQKRKQLMKRTVLSLTLLLAFAASAFAGTNSATFNLSSSAQVGGKTLQPGAYKATWSDDGQVSFSQGKNIVATAHGKLVQLDKKASANSVTTSSGAIQELRFEGKKAAIAIDATDVASTGSTQKSQ